MIKANKVANALIATQISFGSFSSWYILFLIVWQMKYLDFNSANLFSKLSIKKFGQVEGC